MTEVDTDSYFSVFLSYKGVYPEGGYGDPLPGDGSGVSVPSRTHGSPVSRGTLSTWVGKSDDLHFFVAQMVGNRRSGERGSETWDLPEGDSRPFLDH